MTRTTGISYGFYRMLREKTAEASTFLAPLHTLLEDAEVTLSALQEGIKTLEQQIVWEGDRILAQELATLLAAYEYGVNFGEWKYRAELTDFSDLRERAIKELEEWCQDHPQDDPTDEAIDEITDDAVPIYNYDRMSVMLLDLGLACTEDELGDGHSCVEIAGHVIYEEIKSALYERWTEIERERDNEDDENT